MLNRLGAERNRAMSAGLVFACVLLSAFSFSQMRASAAPPAPAENKQKNAAASTQKNTAASGQNKTAPGGKTALSATQLPKIMDFSTSWCLPCKKFAPVFDKVASSYKGRVEFLHYDAENGPGKSLAEKYSVSSYPTVIFFDKSGKKIQKVEEIMKEPDLIKRTEELLK